MSDEFDFESPEDLGDEGNFLCEPGTYHFSILAVHDGKGPKGKPINGFCVSLGVLAGTVSDQKEKQYDLTLFNGKLSSKDGGKFARQKQAAFLIAANLLTPDQLGKKISVDLAKAEGHQVVATLEKQDDSEYLDLHYANIFHVDDPKAKNYPKDEAALKVIPKEFRREASYFDGLRKKKEPAKQTAASALSDSDLDSL